MNGRLLDQTLSRRRFLQLSAAGLVAACGPASGGSSSNSGGSLSGTVNVTYPDQAGFKPKYVQQAAGAVHQQFSGVTVNIDLQNIDDDSFMTKLLLRLSSGDVPDVFHVSGTSIGELADAGYIEPLDSYLSSWSDWAQYPEAVRSGVRYKGKIWAIPYGLDMRWLYFRKDDLQKAGLPADWKPANLQGILDAAAAVKAASSTVLPYALYAGPAGSSGTADHAFVPLLWAYGGELQDSKGKWIGDSPATRKVMAYYAKAYGSGLSPKTIVTATQPWVSMRQKLGNGQLALLFEGGWVYGGWDAADKSGTEQNVGYVLHPTESGGPSFTVGGPGTCWYIAAKSKNKRAAWEFIKAMNSAQIVGSLNAEDPHPVARADAAKVPAFAASKYLVDSTAALKSARFTAPTADYQKVILAIQTATARVASGALGADAASQQYTEDLKQQLGADKVTTQ
jgi:multiple sugar transport system substrate-binding protein